MALFAHELRDVPAPQPALAGCPRSLPSAKGLVSRPGAGGRAARPVGIKHAGLDRGQKTIELIFFLRIDAGSQAESASVGVCDCLIEIVERQDADKWQE